MFSNGQQKTALFYWTLAGKSGNKQYVCHIHVLNLIISPTMFSAYGYHRLRREKKREGGKAKERGKFHLCFLQKCNESMSLGLGFFIFAHSPDIQFSMVQQLKLSWQIFSLIYVSGIHRARMFLVTRFYFQIQATRYKSFLRKLNLCELDYKTQIFKYHL